MQWYTHKLICKHRHTSTVTHNSDAHKNTSTQVATPRTQTHLYVICVDNGPGDICQQVDELFLEEADPLWDLVDDDLDALVVPQDVNTYHRNVAMTCQVTRQHLHHKIARGVGREQVKCPNYTICLTWTGG